MENYLDFLLYNKGLSLNTIIRYRKSLKKFECFLGSIGKSLSRIYEIELSDVYSFIYNERNVGLSTSSCNNSINAIRGYLRYCKNILNLNVLDPTRITGCKAPERNVGFFNKEQKILIKKAVNNGIGKKSITQLRNKLLTYMLMNTGLRVHELAKIKTEEIGESLQVIGKGGKRRVVFLKKELLDMIYEYLSKRNRDSEYLFDSTKEGKHLRESSIRRIYEQLTAKLGFHIHPHRFRHTFCTDLLHIPGANIYNVSKLMGHKRITTTQIYLGCEDVELKKLQFGLKF